MGRRFSYHRRSLAIDAGSFSTAGDWLGDLAARHGLGDAPTARLLECAQALFAMVAETGGTGGTLDLGILLDLDSATLTLSGDTRLFGPPPPAGSAASPGEALAIRLQAIARRVDQFECGDIGPKIRLVARIGCVGASRPAGDSLGQSVLFRDVPPAQLEPILASCEVRAVAAEEILFAAGEFYNCVLVVLEGRLEVRLDGPDAACVVELAAGECVGELSVADGKAASAWVVAACPTRLLVIPEPEFLGSVLAVPAIARNLIVLLSDRMRRGNEQIIARMRATLELDALRRELDVARQIQAGLLPAAPLFQPDAGLEGCGFMRAAQQVGGDFYDAFPVGEGRYFVAIGDVCNKGTSAALYMMRAVTILRSEAVRPFADIGDHLARLAARANDLLNQANELQQFVTVFLAIIDVHAGCVHYVNAGHSRPALRLPGNPPAYLETVKSPLFGIMPDIDYRAGSFAFPPGSLLLLYTDGVTEAESESGTMFGDAALLNYLSGDEACAEVCVARVVAEVDAFAAGRPQSDDITLLAIRRPQPL